MKKIFLIACANFFIVFNSLSQSTEKTDYLQKSKNQKTAAYVLLGVGAALDIAGIITTASNANKELDNLFVESNVNHGGEIALYIAGTAALAGSLVLFIKSKANKNKAMALGINTQQFHQLKKGNLYTDSYLALTLKVRL